jgi:peptide chain release factor 1
VKASIEEKLSRLVERYEEISHLLSERAVISNTDKFRELSKEYSRLEPVAKDFEV